MLATHIYCSDSNDIMPAPGWQMGYDTWACSANLSPLAGHTAANYQADYNTQLNYFNGKAAPALGKPALLYPFLKSEKLLICPEDMVNAAYYSRWELITSYVFNGVNLPGVPNIAGREVSSIKAPARTLLVMEWTAHAPLSWHRSRTGQANTPFYNDAQSVVGFVDGHAALTKIYYDGLNAAYTRDPAPGYAYQYSGD